MNDTIKKYIGEIILLASEECPGCKAIKYKLKEEIEKGFIKVLDVYRDEDAKNIIEELKGKMDIFYVPTILKIAYKDNKLEVCDVTEEKCQIL